MPRSGFKGARGTGTDVEYFDDVDEAVRFLTRHKVEVPDSYRGIYRVSRGDTVIEFKPEGFHDAELRRIHDRVTGRRGNPGRFVNRPPRERNPAKYQVGDQVMRTHRGLTREQALLVVAETDVPGQDNRGRARPAVRAWHVLMSEPGDRPYPYLLEEIRPAKASERSKEAEKFFKR